VTTSTRSDSYAIALLETQIAWQNIESAGSWDELDRAFGVWWDCRLGLRAAILEANE
jgi:hypothetical protein